ncbi:hypothetical protein RCL_jg26352.t1 [Rhizophagus clarus]|uniref:Uncharacterized protein n=1 Tax=Rhizophagus clarus TaxID=94130 RepID=A0A8H3KYB1_9GLOM|nr:hypothetical protein RCL_jg26352.t1 [Rhizophagus clarus]
MYYEPNLFKIEHKNEYSCTEVVFKSICLFKKSDFEFVQTTQKTTFERIYLLYLEVKIGLHEQWILLDIHLKKHTHAPEVPEDGWNRFYFSMAL